MVFPLGRKPGVSTVDWVERLVGSSPDFTLYYLVFILLDFLLWFLPHQTPAVVVQSPSPVWLFVTPWTVAWQAPLLMEFSRQEYWCGLLFPISGDLPDSRARIHDSCVSGIDRWILYLWGTWEAFSAIICIFNVFFFFNYTVYFSKFLEDRV